MKRLIVCSNICNSKTKFDTEVSAHKRNKKIKEKGSTLHVYKCNVCDGWHLTSKDEKERKAILKHIRKTQKKYDRNYKRQIENEAEYWSKKNGW